MTKRLSTKNDVKYKIGAMIRDFAISQVKRFKH